MKAAIRSLHNRLPITAKIFLLVLLISLLGGCTKPFVPAPSDSLAKADLITAASEERESEEGESGYTDPGGAFRFRRLQMQDERGEIPPDAWERARQHVEMMKSSRDQRLRQRQEAGLPTAGIEAAGIDPGSWTWLGPGNVGGRIRSIVIHPTQPNRMWLGSVGGGIWRSQDAGASWAPIDDFLANLAVSSMVLVGSTPDVMYAGTGEGFRNSDSIRGAGVFKSTDGGVTWTRLASTNPTATNPPGCGVGAAPCSSFWNYVNRVAVSLDGSVLLAATSDGNNPPGGGGIARSIDGGLTWTQRTNFATMDVKILGPGNTRAVAGELGSARYSLDGGQTWTAAVFSPPIGNGGTAASDGRVELAVHKEFAFDAFVYASVNQNNGEVFRSNDSGRTYTRYSTGANYLSGSAGNQGWYDNVIWSNPNDPDNVIVGGIFLWRGTIDFGTGTLPLTQISNGSNSPHADNHVIVEHPSFDNLGNRTVFVGNDGGIFRADNFANASTGSGWTELNNTLGITQYYGAAVNSSGVVIGGAQDNGTLKFSGNTEGWTEMNGSDGGYCAADPTDPNYFYGESQNLNIVRSIDGGASASAINSGLGDANTNSNFIAPLIMDPIDPNTLLAGGWSVWRTTNAKAVAPAQPIWTSIKGPAPTPVPAPGTTPTPPPVSAIAVSPITSDLILVGHNDGKVYRTFNGTATNPTWNLISAALPAGRFVTRLVIDPNHATNWYYVTFGGFNADNIYRSTDNGGTWAAVTGAGATALPPVPVRTLAINPINPQFLYAGTEVGIFTSEDTGTTWQLPQDGPANVSVDEIFFDSGKRLYAATHGRGIYRTNGPVLVPPNVTTAADGGPGSLRDAIVQTALVTGTERKILFNISGSGVRTIDLTSPLPVITVPMTIDGWSQGGAGYSGPPLIELNGAGAGANATGLVINGGNSTIRGLVINRFSASGIVLQFAGGNKVQGCYIGTNSSGTAVLSNVGNGISIDNVPNNIIGRQTTAAQGNLISGNTVGILITGSNATGNGIRGNYIGPDVTGNIRLSNTSDGVRLTGAPSNMIGGTDSLAGNIISGNGVISFGADGIEITGTTATGNKVIGNYIGLAADGISPLGNLGSGVRIENASGTTVGGTDGVSSRNVIVDNRSQGGIAVIGQSSTGTTIQGNYLGTDAAGNVALRNNAYNVYLESGNNLVGGTVPGAGNLISGFDVSGGTGIYLFGFAGATGNVIQGNYIGTNAAGTAPLSRVGTGIELRGGSLGTTIGGLTTAARNIISGNSSAIYDYTSNTLVQGNYIGTDVTGTGAVPNVIGVVLEGGSNKTVGGSVTGAGNVISGNGTGGNDHGIRLSNTVSATVQGNRIGTNATGTAALGNGGHGIQVFNSTNCLIGGTTVGARNLISANRFNGISLNTASTTVQGNYIGTDVNGTANLGNGLPTGSAGIEISGGTNNTIGGTNPGEGNIIAFNGCAGCFGVNSGSGLRIFSSGNRVRGNMIFSNVELGIDLSGGAEGANRVTPNDNCDGDGGPNNLQNFPVVTSAAFSGGSVTVSGTLNSTANSTFQVDLYASASCDPSGNGEGQIYLGSSVANTDAACNGNFNVVLPASLPLGAVITATATDSNDNTSEFSSCAPVTGIPTPTPTPPPTPTPTPSATPTPTPSVSISGHARYCSNPGLTAVPNVTLTLTGDSGGSTLTDGAGNYTFASLAFGGTYTVTPSKATLTPGSAGIDTIDVIAAQRHFLNLGNPLSGCRLTSADVNGDTTINTIDVIGIQRFFLGTTIGIANVGKYEFTPASRTYPVVISDQTGQDYDVLVFGDVAIGFIHRPDGGAAQGAAGDGTGADEIPPATLNKW